MRGMCFYLAPKSYLQFAIWLVRFKSVARSIFFQVKIIDITELRVRLWSRKGDFSTPTPLIFTGRFEVVVALCLVLHVSVRHYK